jgi:hypothetical protein
MCEHATCFCQHAGSQGLPAQQQQQWPAQQQQQQQQQGLPDVFMCCLM